MIPSAIAPILGPRAPELTGRRAVRLTESQRAIAEGEAIAVPIHAGHDVPGQRTTGADPRLGADRAGLQRPRPLQTLHVKPQQAGGVLPGTFGVPPVREIASHHVTSPSPHSPKGLPKSLANPASVVLGIVRVSVAICPPIGNITAPERRATGVWK